MQADRQMRLSFWIDDTKYVCVFSPQPLVGLVKQSMDGQAMYRWYFNTDLMKVELLVLILQKNDKTPFEGGVGLSAMFFLPKTEYSSVTEQLATI